ncbi:MAG TPA: hypothetical protein VFV67_18735 [Actinophytocola sp.]|uniref:hypothetical protein n=1 Tax=Actinophytocola sp. TaxID=1872138 RepID=UPI002DB76C31|nr:hypothetical protein [Actinophytocola sp.]HEU5472688.1 hypothetical protein [Actinophytocola sp.]
MPETTEIAIASVLAGGAAGPLHDLVSSKFAGRPEATAALAAAAGAAPESPEVLALGEELALAERSDPGFAAELHALWAGGASEVPGA